MAGWPKGGDPHGHGAVIVVREPWNDRDCRKNGSGKAAYMAKDGR